MNNNASLPRRVATFALAIGLCFGSACLTVGCGSSSDSFDTSEQEADTNVDGLADGSYDIEVETDSSMFRAESCVLVVENGDYVAKLSLPGEGFSRLYFGSADEAAEANPVNIYEYYLSEDGLYTFDLPVEELDEELDIAAYGHRRDMWYNHTITFHAPDGVADVDAA